MPTWQHAYMYLSIRARYQNTMPHAFVMRHALIHAFNESGLFGIGCNRHECGVCMHKQQNAINKLGCSINHTIMPWHNGFKHFQCARVHPKKSHMESPQTATPPYPWGIRQ